MFLSDKLPTVKYYYVGHCISGMAKGDIPKRPLESIIF